MNDAPDIWSLLACPLDGAALSESDGGLSCEQGHRWPVIRGLPVLLPSGQEQTHPEAELALRIARGEDELADEPSNARGGMDPFVQHQLAATCGNLYTPLTSRLDRYPIPVIPLPRGRRRVFVEIGCNWGRWCIAAARQGWRVIGVDPSLRSLLAAQRLAAELGVAADFVVGDARCLPLRNGVADQVFSYSVLQHLARHRVRRCVREAARVLAPAGRCLVQLPSSRGVLARLRSLQGEGRPSGFDCRRWTPAEMQAVFSRLLGPTSLSADGWFTLNPRPEDLPLLPPLSRAVVRASEFLRRLSRRRPWLVHTADSLWVEARKPGAVPARPSLEHGSQLRVADLGC
jgi:SAM-dependent methyltransferase